MDGGLPAASPESAAGKRGEEEIMKRKLAVLATALIAVGLVVQASGASSRDDNILEFKTMIGVSGPFVGPANPINGVPGAGAAWRLDQAKGELRSDGELEVKVEGLVLVNTGANPQAAFRAVVACQTIVNGQAATASAVTGPFPATTAGDSKIEAKVDIPNPCFNPAVFVTTGAGDPPRWFAVTGR
jgi:hypothetical protein